MKKGIIVILLFIFSIVNLYADDDIEEETKTSITVKVKQDFCTEEFFENPFIDDKVYIPPTSTANIEIVINSLADVLSVEETEVKNRYDETIIDKNILISTKDYLVIYHYASSKGIYFRNSFTILQTTHVLKFEIEISMTRDELLDIIGKPFYEKVYDNYSLVGTVGDGSELCIFEIKNHRVDSIRITDGI